jgi:hypothetical protein
VRRKGVLRPCAQFFIYAFDKRSAGLGGMAFEEGEFSVFGYVVRGEEEAGAYTRPLFSST